MVFGEVHEHSLLAEGYPVRKELGQTPKATATGGLGEPGEYSGTMERFQPVLMRAGGIKLGTATTSGPRMF